MNKLNLGFSKTIDQQSVSFEEILRASNEGRLLILTYSAGQTIYRPEYPAGSNRMIPTPVFLNSVLQVVDVMFDDNHQYFETLEECEQYLKELYKE